MPPKKNKHRSFKAIFYTAAFLAVALLFMGIKGMDANRYRDQISVVLSEQAGREIKLNGPVRVGFSIEKGFGFSVEEVTVANPSWASNSLMARVGKLELGVKIIPLLSRRISISKIILSNAEIRVEDSANGESNLVFSSKKEVVVPANDKKAAGSGSAGMSLDIERINISKSQVAIINRDGAPLKIIADDISVKPSSKGVEIAFEGSIDGNKAKATVVGDDPFKALQSPWNFEGNAQYGKYNLFVSGVLKNDQKNVKIEKYKLTSGSTVLTGAMDVSYKGQRPDIKGAVESEKLNIDDLVPDEDKKEADKKAAKSENKQSEPVFSYKPMNLESFKKADLALDVSIGKIPLKVSSIDNFKARVILNDGAFLISPASMNYGDSEVKGQLKLDASSDVVKTSFLVKAHQIDFSKLFNLWGLESFISGKGDVDADIVSFGGSQHDLAKNSNGTINIVMASGKVDAQELRLLVGGVIDTIFPGAGFLAGGSMNCLAARFIIDKGLVKTNGVLLDSPTMSAAAYGGISLGSELINVRVVTDNKTGTPNLVPPVLISGDLANPKVRPEIEGVVQNVTGAFLGLSAPGENTNSVPEVVSVAGQNACVYTLDHPSAKKPTASNIVGKGAEAVNNAMTKTQDATKQILKGLGTKLFGK